MKSFLPASPAWFFYLDRIRRLLLVTSDFSLTAAAYTALVLLIGIGSSWYMIGQGTIFNTKRYGSWIEWPHAARASADPYTRARITRYGILPLSGRIASTFEARFDSSGRRLHSSCEYRIQSRKLNATWWSIAVYDSSGLLIPNAANRYAFDSSTVITRPDNSFVVTLAREARPGNWLPIAGAGRLTLVLTLLQPNRASPTSTPTNTNTGAAAADQNSPGTAQPRPTTTLQLPQIERVYCR